MKHSPFGFVASSSKTLAGTCLLAGLVVIALAAPVISPNDPWDMVGRPFTPPLSDGFLLGSDTLGRDILSGIIHGSRVSLFVGLAATVAALAIGLVVGGVAGFFSGRVDNALMRLTEIFQTIPSFVLAIMLVAVFQPSLASTITAIAVVSWPPIARLARAEFLAKRNLEYVSAAVSAGRPGWDIALREILPNALPPIIVMASLGVATAILLESAISFLGLGDPNLASWGYMIGVGRTVIRQAWWMSVFPGLAIMVAVLAINLLGEGLNDAISPSQRGGAKA
ncbi:ABC transporter permease [Oceaniradius stylonematis]